MSSPFLFLALSTAGGLGWISLAIFLVCSVASPFEVNILAFLAPALIAASAPSASPVLAVYPNFSRYFATSVILA